MAALQNGKPREGSKPESHITPHTTSSKRKQASKDSAPRWVLNNSLRLLLWYVVITAIFRCPTSISDLDEDSPKICHSYFVTRSYIEPCVEPYYRTYAAPYIKLIQPYVQKTDQQILTPASRLAKSSYSTYGAPALEHGKQYSQQQWEKSIAPQIETTKAKIYEIYDSSVSPYLQKAVFVTEPYYASAKETALYLHQKHVLPTYIISKPYIQNAYSSGRSFLIDTGLPVTRRAWSSLVIFVDGKLWPSMKGLYNQNVEPQLVMIGERLARYRESRRLKSAMEDVTGSPASSTPLVDSATTSSKTSISEQEEVSQTDEALPERTSLTPTEQIAAARDKIASDLHKWQEKFAVAADKGVDDLTDRVDSIMGALVSSEIDGVAKGLSRALNQTTQNEIADLKVRINQAVSNLPDQGDIGDVEAAENEIFGSVRSAGMAIRERAHALREWYNGFDAMVMKRAYDASESTLDVLDHIRDLGLQEIGMRWAWMDGVTYQDWAKYHQLKKQFESWRTEVEEVAMKHESLEKAKTLSGEVVTDAMELAEKAAKELVRLKEVGKWKVQARDSSEDFESKQMPAAAVLVGSSLAENVKEASKSLVGPNSGTAETIVSKATSTIADSLSAASTALVSESTGIMNEASSAFLSATSSMSEAISQGTEAVVDGAETLSASFATAFQESAPSDQEGSQGVLARASDSVESVLGEESSSVSPLGQTASSKVWNGAMAHKVNGRGPILDAVLEDEDESPLERLESLVGEAGDHFAEVAKAIRQAVFGTTQAAGESATSVAKDKYSSAFAAASSVLYRPSEDAIKSTGGMASDRFAQAVSAASSAIYGTPTPFAESLYSQASSTYLDAVSRAAENYSHAKSIASSQISGTPKPVHDQIFSSIEAAYSGSLHAANERLEAAKNAAKSQYSQAIGRISILGSTTTQGVLESISSIASARLQEGLVSASEQYSRAKATYGPTPTPTHQALLQEARRRYYEAIGFAHGRYSEFIEAGSSIVYGTKTSAYESAYTAASGAIYGTSVPAYQSMIDVAQSHYSAASSVAAATLDAAVNSAKSLAGAKSKNPSQAALEFASSQYQAALDAASSALVAASSAAQTAVYGTATGNVESLRDQAVHNWETLVSKASEQIYGASTPYSDKLASQAGAYSAQVTDAASAQYSAVRALVSELVIGREPDFAESVISRLNSAIHTGYHVNVATSVSSFANEAYSSVSSAASAYLTPLPSVEAMLQSATERLNSIVNAASTQMYGSSTGGFEKATSAIADSYHSAASAASAQYESVSIKASEAFYGTQTTYGEAAVSSISDVMSSARDAISSAIYGTSTGSFESITSAASSMYATASSNIAENIEAASSAAADAYSSAKSHVNEAIHGPEKAAMESVQSRLSIAMESARAKVAAFAGNAGDGAASVFEVAKSSVEEFASNVSSAASSFTNRAKDEL